jgi:cell division protein FtsL
MATLPKIFQRQAAPRQAGWPDTAYVEPGVCALRALPHEDVFFFCKKIDNTRLVREPDPTARGTCWNAIGAACLVVLSLGIVMAPKVTSTMEGYKLESLRSEEQRLLDERRAVDLQEAQLLSPERLELLAKKQKLAPPAANQVFHLETRPDSAVAMVK